MTSSLRDPAGAGLEHSCDPDEWVDATGPVDGVELFRARLRGRPFSRHRHDVYAIGVTEEGVQAFHYRGTVERSLPGQVFVLHPDELHDGRADGPGLFGYRQIYVNPDRIASALPSLTGRPVQLPFAPPVTDDPVLARLVRTAFARAPEPLALDALVLQLAEGLLRFSAAGLTGTLRCRVDLPAVERGRDFLRSRLTIVQSSEVEAVTRPRPLPVRTPVPCRLRDQPVPIFADAAPRRGPRLAARHAAPRRNGARRRLRRPGPLHPDVQSGIRHDARPVREALRRPCW